MEDSPSHSALRATAPEFIPSADETLQTFFSTDGGEDYLQQNEVLPTDVPLYGTLHGITYDAQRNTTSVGQTLASLVRKGANRPRLTEEPKVEDLQIQSPEHIASLTAQQNQCQSVPVEVLCRCHGQGIWITGEDVEDHVCYNTGVGENWFTQEDGILIDHRARGSFSRPSSYRRHSSFDRERPNFQSWEQGRSEEASFTSPQRGRRFDRTPPQAPKSHHRGSQGTWRSPQKDNEG